MPRISAFKASAAADDLHTKKDGVFLKAKAGFSGA
jgi:hypothetical protein